MGADAMAVPAQLVDHKTFAYVRCMARAAELDVINAFVAVRGATRCPPAFAAPAIGALPSAQEAAKLAGVQVPAALTRREWRLIFCRRRSRPVNW